MTGTLCGIQQKEIAHVTRSGQTIPENARINPSGTSYDFDANNVPDPCDIADSISLDCNQVSTPDECERDSDEDGIPDDCLDTFDHDGNNIVDLLDLADFLVRFGL